MSKFCRVIISIKHTAQAFVDNIKYKIQTISIPYCKVSTHKLIVMRANKTSVCIVTVDIMVMRSKAQKVI